MQYFSFHQNDQKFFSFIKILFLKLDLTMGKSSKKKNPKLSQLLINNILNIQFPSLEPGIFGLERKLSKILYFLFIQIKNLLLLQSQTFKLIKLASIKLGNLCKVDESEIAGLPLKNTLIYNLTYLIQPPNISF